MLNTIYHSIDPVAFSAGPFTVRWYGLAYMVGFLVAAFLMYRTARRWKLNFNFDALLTLILCLIIGVILGGRLGYVLFYGGGYYLEHPTEILMFNQGGMSFHGGLIGAVVAEIIGARIAGMPLATVGDLLVIAAPVGLFLGRCANFINGELWGATTDLPWGVVFGGTAGSVPRHPSQLYEALLEGVLMFIILYTLSRKMPPRPRGTFIGLFLVLYGIFRFLIEFVRQPDAHIGYLAGGWLTMGQVLSLPLIVVGIVVLAWAARMKLPQCGLADAQNAVE